MLIALGRYGLGGCHGIVSPLGDSKREREVLSHICGSDYSGDHIKLKKILLNGNNICMVCWSRIHLLLGLSANFS